MNQNDRNRLARLYGCLSRWPWPNRRRTLGPSELSDFFLRCEDLIPQVMQCIVSISRSDLEDPDEELDHLDHLIGSITR